MRRISEAAADLLLEHDFADITTKDIAERARVGEATLFRYVKNKQQLLDLVYGDRLDDVLDQIEIEDLRTVAAAKGADLSGLAQTGRVMSIYKGRCDFYLVSPANAALYLREGFDVSTDDSARHLAQGDRSIRLARQILEDGQRSGTIRTDVDAQMAAQNCHSIFIHEVDRTPVRGFEPSTIWSRLSPRLEAQLLPLVIDGSHL